MTALYWVDVAHAHVEAARRLGDALDAVNGRASAAVCERHYERADLLWCFNVGEIALAFERLGNGQLHL